MDWKVVAKGSSPSAESIDALTGLTGLRRDEVLLALTRGTLVASSGLAEHRAQILGDSLSRDPGITCRVMPDTTERSAGPRFTVLLSGFAPGYRTRLRRKLQELTGLPPEQVVVWLSRMPFALSRNVDGDTARRIRNMISSVGGVVTVEADKGNASATGRPEGRAVFATPEPSVRTAAIGPAGPGVIDGTAPDVDTGIPEPGDQTPGAPESDVSTITRGEPPVSPTGVGTTGPPPGPCSCGGGQVQEQLGPPEQFTPGGPPVGSCHPPAPLRRSPSSNLRSVIPHRFSFDVPPPLANCLPRIVGYRNVRRKMSGPTPQVAFLFPPAATVPLEMLLPPVPVLPERITEPRGEKGPPPILAAGAEPDAACDVQESESDSPMESLRPILPVQEDFEDGPPPSVRQFRAPKVPLAGRPVSTEKTGSEPPPVIAAVVSESMEVASPEVPGTEGAAGLTDAVRGRPRRRKRRFPVMSTPPPASYQPPPELASLQMYVCTPSPGTRDRVESALEEVLGLPRSMAEGLLERCPSWLAGFRSPEKAAEVQGNLERRGVTVSLTRNLMSVTSPGGGTASKGFQDWLSANG